VLRFGAPCTMVHVGGGAWGGEGMRAFWKWGVTCAHCTPALPHNSFAPSPTTTSPPPPPHLLLTHQRGRLSRHGPGHGRRPQRGTANCAGAGGWWPVPWWRHACGCVWGHGRHPTREAPGGAFEGQGRRRQRGRGAGAWGSMGGRVPSCPALVDPDVRGGCDVGLSVCAPFRNVLVSANVSVWCA
jgi:hypothetical protein